MAYTKDDDPVEGSRENVNLPTDNESRRTREGGSSANADDRRTREGADLTSPEERDRESQVPRGKRNQKRTTL